MQILLCGFLTYPSFIFRYCNSKKEISAQELVYFHLFWLLSSLLYTLFIPYLFLENYSIAAKILRKTLKIINLSPSSNHKFKQINLSALISAAVQKKTSLLINKWFRKINWLWCKCLLVHILKKLKDLFTMKIWMDIMSLNTSRNNIGFQLMLQLNTLENS